MPHDLPSLAHSRIEILDRVGLPLVVIIGPDGAPFSAWQRYVEEHRLGIGSQRSYSRSLGLFIDFTIANGDAFLPKAERHRLFQAFADALVWGTVRDGADPSGLWWFPRSAAAAKRAVVEVTAFTDWLAESATTNPINPTRTASIAERLLFWRAWQQSSRASLLRHIKSANRARAQSFTARMVGVRRRSPIATQVMKAFPEELFADLLTMGFRRSRPLYWTILRDQMVALLLHGGGLRLSEALHLWVMDVFEAPHDADEALVKVFHPSEGLVPYRDPKAGRTRQVQRADYLRQVYDRKPLTDLPGRKAVGWKDPLLTDPHSRSMQVFWRSSEFGRVFMRLYRAYVQARPRVASHPHLFVATGGEPMTVKAYEKVHAAAVRRLGLEPAKALGTTPHGHRHAYGHWLWQANVDPKIRQLALHHKSTLSQEIYTEASLHEVVSAFAKIDQDCCLPDLADSVYGKPR
jgi:site-specific recombinase XerD